MKTTNIKLGGLNILTPAGEAKRVRAIVRASNDEGTIQAADLVSLFPGEPTRHTTARLGTVLGWIGAEIVG